MKCKEMQKHLDDYILGELDSVVEIQMNEHLAECKKCQKILEEKEAAMNVFRNTQRFEPAAGTSRRPSRHRHT